GNNIAALSNVKVRFRKFVSVEKLGTTAPALISRKFTSRMLDDVPPNDGNAEPKLFACENIMSEFAAVAVRVIVPPAAVNGPVCVILPPDVIFKFCPTDEVPKTNGILLIKFTAL